MQYHRDCVGNDRSTSMPPCIYLYNMHRRVQTCALQVNTYTYGLSECMWNYVPNHLHSHTYHSDPCAPGLCFLMLSISKSPWSVSSFAIHGPLFSPGTDMQLRRNIQQRARRKRIFSSDFWSMYCFKKLWPRCTSVFYSVCKGCSRTILMGPRMWP